MHQDRLCRVRLALDDWAASLGTVVDLVEGENAELIDIECRSWTPTDNPNRCPVLLTLEGNGSNHLDKVIDALNKHEDITVE